MTCRTPRRPARRPHARGVFLLFALTLAAAANTQTASAQSSGAQARPGPVRSGQQVVLITGSTDGLGREVARRLAATGAHVIVHGRNRERGAALVAEIEGEGKGSAAFYPADLASLAEVRRLGEAILEDYDRLDVVINNAGIWLTSGGRQLSADGHEMHFAVNYLSGFLLTHMLLPRLRQSPAARIVNVSSLAQAAIDFDNVMLERGYTGSRAYAQSKLAQAMFTFDLARDLAGSNVAAGSSIAAYALHPATMMDTHMVTAAGARPRTTVAEGADAVVHVVTASGLESGQYFNGKRPTRAGAQAYDETARAKLRALSRELTGLR